MQLQACSYSASPTGWDGREDEWLQRRYYIAYSTALEVGPDEVALVERLRTTDQYPDGSISEA